MTCAVPQPFVLQFDPRSGALEPHTSHVVRRASDLSGAFSDKDAWERLIIEGDPIIYEVFQHDVPEQAGQLIGCTTVLNPGTVGDEYYLTKGHYHALRETGEVYYGLSGQRYLLLRTETGASEALPMGTGRLAYVPPLWAHRSVNTGSKPYVFHAIYPGDAGHDYAAVEKAGFARRVFVLPTDPR